MGRSRRKPNLRALAVAVARAVEGSTASLARPSPDGSATNSSRRSGVSPFVHAARGQGADARSGTAQEQVVRPPRSNRAFLRLRRRQPLTRGALRRKTVWWIPENDRTYQGHRRRRGHDGAEGRNWYDRTANRLDGELRHAHVSSVRHREDDLHDHRDATRNAALFACGSAPAQAYCGPPDNWCAGTVCPTTTGISYLCPNAFTANCAEPNLWSIMLHESGALPAAVRPMSSLVPRAIHQRRPRASQMSTATPDLRGRFRDGDKSRLIRERVLERERI